MKGLAIREVAERTGIAPGTIRMWEQRYGFPDPQRSPAGYRLYSTRDVDVLRRVMALRETGLSVPAALERARATGGLTDRPSLFGAVPSQGRARRLKKRTLIAMSRAIEDETLARGASPVVIGAFQRRRHYRAVAHRYRRLAGMADAVVAFADFEAPDADGVLYALPIPARSAIGQEWAVVVDAPGLSVCLVAWEPPVPAAPADDLDREFEAFWTLDAQTVRQASVAGAAAARATAPDVGDRIEALLAERPIAAEQGTEAVEALVARMIAYVQEA